MALFVTLSLIFLFALRTLVGWRKGILLMIVLAAIQDPLRKMVPGTPGWLALATVPVFLALIFASAGSSRRWWPEFRRSYPSIGRSLGVLVVLSLPAALISATYGEGTWMLTILGALSYSLIFLAMIAGFHYPRRLSELRALLSAYCAIHGVALSGGILEFLDLFPNWQVLGSGALGYDWIRWGQGYLVDMISGFYRSPDVMGWHASAVCMLSLLLVLTGRGPKRYFWLLMTAVAIIALLLCGRRKMVYMLPVFVLSLGYIYWQAGRAGKAWAIIGVVVLPAAALWMSGDVVNEESSSNVRYYTETSNETMDRFRDHGFASVIETYRQTGFFGAGLGTATPGSHHLKVERPRVWQESAPSRILVELGVLGGLAFLAVLFMIVRSLWRLTMRLLKERSQQAYYAAGLVAFFLANVSSLMVSGQILADPFVATFLGFLVGLTLSLSRPQLLADDVPAKAKPVYPAPPPTGISLR